MQLYWLEVILENSSTPSYNLKILWPQKNGFYCNILNTLIF